MKKILNITHLGMDGALCSILLQKKFSDANRYTLDVIPIPANRIDNLISDSLTKYCNEFDIIYVTGLTPSLGMLDKIKGTKIVVFSRFGNGYRANSNSFLNENPEVLTSDMLLKSICRGDMSKPMQNLISATRDYELNHLKYRASIGLNYIFKGLYRFEEYIVRFKDGYDGFSESEKTHIIQKEEAVKKLEEEIRNKMWCGTIDKMNISISPVYDYPNELMKSMFILEPYTDIAILMNMEKRFGSVRIMQTDKNKKMDTTLEVFLSTFISRNGRGAGNSGNFSWTEKEESDMGIPVCFVNFLKWNEKLGIENFNPNSKEVEI